jgi:trehalose synthase
MLRNVAVGEQAIEPYRAAAGDDAIDVLHELASPLAGARVLHVSATPYGGGVAELLRSEVPLLSSLGLHVEWQIIGGDDEFFSVTKTIHNALQGASDGLTAQQWDVYRATSERNADALSATDFDVIVVHDPQPLALAALSGHAGSQWVWRCHIDTSEPNLDVWRELRSFLDVYDAAIFTLGGFVPPDFPVARIEIIPPAIDPESPKNIELGQHLAQRVLRWIGVDLDRPLVTQVSRFDPWKDPLGVIAAYRIAKRDVPDLQLALVGSMALDDPQGWEVYAQIEAATRDDHDIRLFTNLTGVGNVEVNAFQRLSNVVVQKSIREGFGLVVSETLWKQTPVVAGRAGGIPLQLRDGGGGFLVDSVEECAARIVELLTNPDEAEALGRRGRDLVRDRFLLPRLLADDLRLYGVLLGHEPAAHERVAESGLNRETRDPVCGMRIDDVDRAPAAVSDGRTYWFCSHSCRHEFLADPQRFLRSDTGELPRVDVAPDVREGPA